MKKFLAITATACVLASPVAAENDNYVRLGVGMLSYEDQSFSLIGTQNDDRREIGVSDYDPGTAPIIRLEIGRSLAPHWRAGLSVESNLASTESDSVSGSLNNEPVGADLEAQKKLATDLLMANGYYHLWADRAQGDFDPFITGGLGIALHTVTNSEFINDAQDARSFLSDGDATQLAWRVGAGVAYWITDRIQVDASVAYLDAGSVRFAQNAMTAIGDDFVIEPLANTAEVDVKAYELQVGASFRF